MPGDGTLTHTTSRLLARRSTISAPAQARTRRTFVRSKAQEDLWGGFTRDEHAARLQHVHPHLTAPSHARACARAGYVGTSIKDLGLDKVVKIQRHSFSHPNKKTLLLVVYKRGSADCQDLEPEVGPDSPLKFDCRRLVPTLKVLTLSRFGS